MKLEQQSYQISDWQHIEVVSHTELLWINKQIIRLTEVFFTRINDLLNLWNKVSLYNHYNPINADLIRHFREEPKENSWAVIAKISWKNDLWPIIEANSLKKVEVIKMDNIYFEDIQDIDLRKSIAFNWNEVSVAELIEWLSKEFYSGRLSIEEIEKYQKLFFREITL